MSAQCPLYPRKQTLNVAVRMSAWCHKPTSARGVAAKIMAQFLAVFEWTDMGHSRRASGDLRSHEPSFS